MTREERARAYIKTAIHPKCLHLSEDAVQLALAQSSDCDVSEFYRVLANASCTVMRRELDRRRSNRRIANSEIFQV
jgi:hypothetical protein